MTAPSVQRRSTTEVVQVNDRSRHYAHGSAVTASAVPDGQRPKSLETVNDRTQAGITIQVTGFSRSRDGQRVSRTRNSSLSRSASLLVRGRRFASAGSSFIFQRQRHGWQASRPAAPACASRPPNFKRIRLKGGTYRRHRLFDGRLPRARAKWRFTGSGSACRACVSRSACTGRAGRVVASRSVAANLLQPSATA